MLQQFTNINIYYLFKKHHKNQVFLHFTDSGKFLLLVKCHLNYINDMTKVFGDNLRDYLYALPTKKKN